MQPQDIDRLCKQRGWSRARLMLEMRRAGKPMGVELPGDESLRRMVREWAHGRRGLSSMYAELLSTAFGVPFGQPVSSVDDSEQGQELAARLARVESCLDMGMIQLFEGQTQSFRMIDRRLGAGRLLVQSETHVSQMSDLLTYCLPGSLRRALSQAVAEAAALAGWQALDLGYIEKAWSLHEVAKSAARESGNMTVVAHVTAQQAYALLDLGRALEAAQQISAARSEAGTSIPPVMHAWLWAAEAESLAASGDISSTLRALDEAGSVLPTVDDDEFPFLVLDSTHLARWRGHCLARIGASEAVTDLSAAVESHDAAFTRAAAALHADLALAHTFRGELDAARANAEKASHLAEITSSVRQQRRIAQVLARVSA